jgi:hypothetical protein
LHEKTESEGKAEGIAAQLAMATAAAAAAAAGNDGAADAAELRRQVGELQGSLQVQKGRWADEHTSLLAEKEALQVTPPPQSARPAFPHRPPRHA